MMEFEINMSEMPLGKLSKRHIQRGWLLWNYCVVLLFENFVTWLLIYIHADCKSFCAIAGYEVLTEIQNILKDAGNGPRQQGLLVDASNRFFTLIPTVHPMVISNEQTLKSKVIGSHL